ncbi:MAG: antitoxin VapB family protein [Candidatus Hodarchaeales archaeon]|jgi:predicted CopG family antitoxin
MARNISLSDKAYEKLTQIKRKHESYSNVILRLLSQKKSIKEIAGKNILPESFSLKTVRNLGSPTLRRLENESP